MLKDSKLGDIQLLLLKSCEITVVTKWVQTYHPIRIIWNKMPQCICITQRNHTSFIFGKFSWRLQGLDIFLKNSSLNSATTREVLKELFPLSPISCIPTDIWGSRNLEGLDGRLFKKITKKEERVSTGWFYSSTSSRSTY